MFLCFFSIYINQKTLLFFSITFLWITEKLKPSRYNTNPLFKSSRILKLTDYIILQNFLFAHDNINKNLPSSLISSFFVFQSYNRSLRGEKKHQLKKRQTRTVLYGSKSVRSKSIEDWNNINDSLHHLHLHFKSKNTCKNIISNFLLDQYQIITPIFKLCISN